MSFRALNFHRMQLRQWIEAGDADKVYELRTEYDGVWGLWEARGRAA